MPSTATQFDTDCVLMLHMDGADGSQTFTDSSFSNQKTMTAAGNAQIDDAVAQFAQSGLFDGAGDDVNTPASVDFDFGTGDFTIDFWAEFDSGSAEYACFTTDDTNGGTLIRKLNGSFSFYAQGSLYSFAYTFPSNTLEHYAFTRSGSNLRAFVNGTQIGTTQTSNDNIDQDQIVRIGRNTVTLDQDLAGHIDEFRVVKGTAVWTADFTAPTAAYTQAGGVTVDESFTFSMN